MASDNPFFPPPPSKEDPYRAALPTQVIARPSPTIVQRPSSESSSPSTTDIDAPDALARALGPPRMPRVIVRFPRISGVALGAMGVWGVAKLHRLSETGGTYLRAFPIVAFVALFLGAWLVILGRPADRDGYAPSWWNVGYVAMLALAVLAALVASTVWL